jgi:aldehyde dehydrogenase
MPYLSEDKIASIVDRVVARLGNGDGGRAVRDGSAGSANSRGWSVSTAPASTLKTSRRSDVGLRGVFADLDEAVKAAQAAFQRYSLMGLQTRYQVIAAMRREATRHIEAMAKAAFEETGLGRVDQKVIKNRLVIDKTPGPEILDSWAQSGDEGLVLEEYAPFGVIGAITPMTNPTETIICNGIGMLAAGNAVIFNAHPKAKNCSATTVDFLNQAIVAAGGPENLLTCTAEPTIDSAQKLMRHPGISLLVVTGGPAVVKEAMASGKKCIAAGPGNPPVVVDESADLEQAAKGVVAGVSFDNNIVCVAEKEIIVVAAIADQLKQNMKRCGAYELSRDEAAKVEKVVVEGAGPNKKWVGKDASAILREAGINAPAGTLMAFAEVPEEHPFVQHELLLPVTGLVRAANVRDAIAAAVRCEHGNWHSASMYSKNIENMHTMARAINTTIFTKNTPTCAGLGYGGEGYCSFTIATPTGEGLTNARHFSRKRRCVLKDYFRIV